VQLLGKKGVEEIQPNELPANKDWCLGKFESRIRHFECLHMFSPDQQKVATAAVFNGLQIRQTWVQKARTYLGCLGLKPGHFVAAHLRRTDFTPCGEGFACLGSATLEKAIPTLNRYGEGRDVLILTDDPNPKFLQQLKDGAKAPTSMFFSRGQQSPSLEAAIVDMLLGAMAGTFIGTPTSTFSLSIHEMRRKMEICKKAPRITHSLGLLQTSKGQVRQTRWFDPARLDTTDESARAVLYYGIPASYMVGPNKMNCEYNIQDFKKFTQFTDFDVYKGQALCQLEDVK